MRLAERLAFGQQRTAYELFVAKRFEDAALHYEIAASLFEDVDYRHSAGTCWLNAADCRRMIAGGTGAPR